MAGTSQPMIVVTVGKGSRAGLCVLMRFPTVRRVPSQSFPAEITERSQLPRLSEESGINRDLCPAVPGLVGFAGLDLRVPRRIVAGLHQQSWCILGNYYS